MTPNSKWDSRRRSQSLPLPLVCVNDWNTLLMTCNMLITKRKAKTKYLSCYIKYKTLNILYHVFTTHLITGFSSWDDVTELLIYRSLSCFILPKNKQKQATNSCTMGSGDKWLLGYQILVETVFHYLLYLKRQHLSYISINKTVIKKTLINVFMGICYWDNAMFIITLQILFYFANYYPNIL